MPNKKQFVDSLTRIIDYLEEERKDYDAQESDCDRKHHIYTHVCNIRDWIQEEVNTEETQGMDTAASFQQIRAEVKERNMLFTAVKNMRAVANCATSSFDSESASIHKYRFWNIFVMCDNAIRQIDATDRVLDTRNISDNSLDVDRIAKYLVSVFWLGAEIGLGNSCTRDMSQEQYYELNKNEWINKAECLINEVSRVNIGAQSDTTNKEGDKNKT